MPTSDPDTPQRPAEPAQHVVGIEGLKALAHPLRLRLLDELSKAGRSTASKLGVALGESSGSTSYHLRQLAKHGFIEDDATETAGRERYWVQRPGGWNLPVFDFDQPAAKAAIDLVLREQWEADYRRMRELLAQAPTWPQEWQDAAVRRSAHLTLSAAQAAEMDRELDTVIDRYRELTPGTESRRVSVVLSITPTEHGGSV